MKSGTITLSAKNFLVRELKISNKEAIDCILEKRMSVNGKISRVKQVICSGDTVELDGRLLKAAEKPVYLAYNKPRGIETTLNKQVSDNLADALNFSSRVYPAGRLDKESEGLLLLTNDGHIFNKIIHSEQQQEKEYIVRVDKILTKEVLLKLASGVSILGRVTLPAKVVQMDACTFRIILLQGLNRQIRRMCYKLGYEVLILQRIRIINIHLGSLSPGQWRHLSEAEILELSQITKTIPSL